MKFVCHKMQLLDIINTVQRAVSAKPALQILECIKIDASANGDLVVTGNNLDLCVEYKTICPVEEGGVIALNSKMFGEIVRRLPDDDVNIKVNEENDVATITCKKSEFNIQGISPNEFPAVPEIEENYHFSMPEKALKNMIRKSVFAVAMNDMKYPIITGELFEIENGVLKVVATDRHRLAYITQNISDELPKKKFVVPGQTLREMLKILKDEDNQVEISVSSRHAMFDFGSYKMITRLLEGEYMNYYPVLKTPNSIFVNLKSKALCDSLERSALVMNEEISSKSEKTPVRLNIAYDKIEISCMTGKGQIHDIVDADLEGEGLEIGFNYRYLLEALRSCEEENVRLEFSHPLAPCFIRSQKDEENCLYMVSPIRLNN